MERIFLLYMVDMHKSYALHTDSNINVLWQTYIHSWQLAIRGSTDFLHWDTAAVVSTWYDGRNTRLTRLFYIHLYKKTWLLMNASCSHQTAILPMLKSQSVSPNVLFPSLLSCRRFQQDSAPSCPVYAIVPCTHLWWPYNDSLQPVVFE